MYQQCCHSNIISPYTRVYGMYTSNIYHDLHAPCTLSQEDAQDTVNKMKNKMLVFMEMPDKAL